MANTIELRAANGVRNDLTPDRFAPGDLEVAVNVDIDETGKTFRRLGTIRRLSGNMHSLWADPHTGAFVVNDGVLSAIKATGEITPIVAVSGTQVAYHALGPDVFWTDGLTTGVIRQGENRSWGLPVPDSISVEETFGYLPAGTYLVTAAHVSHTGVEHGAPMALNIDIQNGGIRVSGLATTHPDVAYTVVYCSAVNGEVPQSSSLVLASVDSVVISVQSTGAAVRTQFFGPPPAGQAIAMYNGRVYVASGNAVYYSAPYEYELFDKAYGFLTFTDDVMTMAPVRDGIFIGTAKQTFFLRGPDPESFTLEQVAPYGTVLGTVCYVRNDLLLDGSAQGKTPTWASKKGICLGMDGGQMVALTSNRYGLPEVSEGASVMKIRSGTPQLVTTFYY